MKLAQVLVLAALSATLAACGGGSATSTTADDGVSIALASKAPTDKGPAVKVASVTLPAATAAVIAVPVSITASVTDRNGRTLNGVALNWSAADPTIAQVDATGRVKPIRAGFTRVTAAASGGISGTTLVSVRGPTPIPTRSRLVGTNLAGIAYWSSQFPFSDLMKSSSGWSSIEDNGTRGAAFPTLTPGGYPATLKPGQHAISFVSSAGTHRPVGRYVVLWDGDGSISFPWSNVAVVETAPRRIVLDVTAATSELWVQIDATQSANPLRNLRFLAPGTESTYATQPFHPAFLQKVAPYSTLRFMDWGATNGSPQVNWADRATPGDLTWASAKGVPLEVMIELANTLRVDPWFCIPHQASDDYVTRFSTLLHEKLDPSLRPHIEYSNEVWNTGFAQTQWAVAQSNLLKLPVPYGQPSAFYATRSVQVFNLVRQAYGPADAPRVVRVLAGQAVWTQFLESALAWNNAAASADAMAVAPYFSAVAAADPAQAATTLTLSADQIVDQIVADVRGSITTQLQAHAALAGRYGLKLKGYEGGSGNTSAYFAPEQIDAMTSLFAAANRHPRMRDVYKEFYDAWKLAGGDTLNQYHDVGPWTKYGFWGALEFASQDPLDAPKYQGLLDVIAANPAP